MVLNGKLNQTGFVSTFKKIKHIEEIDKKTENGLACNCICDKCGKVMQAVQGEKRDWHFRHDSRSTCNGGQESVLHKFGKQILMDAKALEIPKHGRFEYDEAIPEKFLPGTKFRSDICLTSFDRTVHVEILVNHQNDGSKETYYEKNRVESLEIDLSDFIYSFSDAKLVEIRQAILEGLDYKRIIYWKSPTSALPQNQSPKEAFKNSNDYKLNGILVLMLSFLAGIGLLRLFKKNRRNGNNTQRWKRKSRY